MQRSAGCANSIKADSCSRKFLGTPNSLRLTARQISQSCKGRSCPQNGKTNRGQIRPGKTLPDLRELGTNRSHVGTQEKNSFPAAHSHREQLKNGVVGSV